MTESKKPTHTAFVIVGEGSKGRWREVGAGWTTQDGKGLMIQLDCFPVKDGRIVIREAERARA